MAKKVIHYSEIKWETIDYTIVTKVVDICRTIKEHYWNNRPCGSYRSEIIANGLMEGLTFYIDMSVHQSMVEP